MVKSQKPIGIVVYKGPSLIDGKPIIVVATGVWNKTVNRKIGNMIQFWILRRDIPPILAGKIGEDYSVCGDCKHRDFGSCYVNLCHGPRGVYDAFHRDRYVDFKPDMIKHFVGKSLRIRAYGDPAAVSFDIWDIFVRASRNHTGYTHQWKNCDQRLKNIVMASVDDKEEKEKAKAMDWRTFRIRLAEDDSKGFDEFVCPASKEAGKRLLCFNCGACGGRRSGGVYSNPTIIVHGGGATGYKTDRFRAGMKKKRHKKKYRREFVSV